MLELLAAVNSHHWPVLFYLPLSPQPCQSSQSFAMDAVDSLVRCGILVIEEVRYLLPLEMLHNLMFSQSCLTKLEILRFSAFLRNIEGVILCARGEATK